MSAESDSLEHYRENLRHVVRPEERRDREESPGIVVLNWEGLALVEGLREYAAYHSPSQEHEEIALAYVEYIRMVVYEERPHSFVLYAHTDKARRVLTDSVRHIPTVEVAGLLSKRVQDKLW